MKDLTHSLKYELPQYAQQILENSHTPNLGDTTTIALPSSSPLEASTTQQITTSEFLKKLGATFIHSIQLQSLHKSNTLEAALPAAVPAITSASTATLNSNMDMNLEFATHRLVMDSLSYNTAMDELQKQLDYDKFMNEVWIGVVLTLILISMIFCFCSCFLYHQFRVWKRSYRTTVADTSDSGSTKLSRDIEDPVPEYTLVSGLPSYEAALELLNKTSQSCLIVHPSVFEIFNKNEKFSNDSNSATECIPPTASEVTEPLLIENNKFPLPSYTEATTPSTTTITYDHSLSIAQQKSQPKTKTANYSAEKLLKS